MQERLAQVATDGGLMETFVAHPDKHGPFPAVILYMDVWGIREELFGLARRVAARGYCALVPDLYWRQGLVRHDFRDENGRMSFELVSWVGFMGPAKLPAEIVPRLNQVTNDALADPAVRVRLEQIGYSIAGGPSRASRRSTSPSIDRRLPCA